MANNELLMRRRAMLQAGYCTDTVTGTDAITLPKAKANGLKSLTAYGGTEHIPKAYLDSVTQEGAVEQRNLPQGYTELEYIESDGNQYIDTGRKATQTSKIECEWMYPAASSASGSGRVFGSRYTSGTNRHACAIGTNYGSASTSTNVFGVFGSSGMLDSNAVQIDHWYSASMDINGLTLDGTLIPAPASDDFETPYTIKLFTFGQSAPGGDESATPRGIIRMRKYRQYDDGVLVLDLRPAKRLSDNAIGKYDTVSGQFFPNEGTGNFVAGPALAPTPTHPMDLWCNNGKLKARHQSGLPLGYQLVEYLTFTGTQYIDTGKYCTEKTEIRTKLKSASTESRWAYGAGSSNPRVTLFRSSTGNQRFGNATVANTNFPAQTDVTVVQNKDSLTLNNRSFAYTGVTDFTTGETLAIGVCNGSQSESTPWFAGDFYYYQKYEDGVLDANLVPVRTETATPEYGLYDLVSGQFLTNAGTGAFTGGTDVSDPVEVYVEQTESTNRFDVSKVAGTGISVSGNTITVTSATSAGVVTTVPLKTVLPGAKAGETYTVSLFNVTGTVVNYIWLRSGASGGKWENGTSKTLTQGDLNGYFKFYGTGTLKVQIERGSTASTTYGPYYNGELLTVRGSTQTAYEPYITPQTASVTDLFAVGNYKDTDEIINGLLTHKVGVKVLTGAADENWETTAQSTVYRWSSPVPFRLPNIGICSHYVGVSSDLVIANMPDMSIKTGSSNSSYVYIKDSSYSNDLPGLKAYLAAQYAAGTPVIVLYPLATSTTESHEKQLVGLTADYNNVDIHANVTVPTPTLVTSTHTTPAPDYLLDLRCNNGVLGWNGSAITVTGTQEEITVTGKNLYNPDATATGKTLNDDGELVELSDSNLSRYTDIIPVKPSTKYAFQLTRTAASIYTRICTYDAGGQFIALKYKSTNTTATTLTTTFTTETNAAYVRMSFKHDSTDIQLEEGNTQTAYEPYHAPQTVSVTDLLAVGSYKDAQEIISGLKTGKVGIYVCTGDELKNAGAGSDGRYEIRLPDDGLAEDRLRGVCTHYKWKSSTSVPNTDGDFALYYRTVSGVKREFFGFQDSRFASLADAQAFFRAQYNAGTPVIVLYPLATETTESVTPQPVAIVKGTNVATITQASMTGLGLSATYKRKK